MGWRGKAREVESVLWLSFWPPDLFLPSPFSPFPLPFLPISLLFPPRVIDVDGKQDVNPCFADNLDQIIKLNVGNKSPSSSLLPFPAVASVRVSSNKLSLTPSLPPSLNSFLPPSLALSRSPVPSPARA